MLLTAAAVPRPVSPGPGSGGRSQFKKGIIPG